MLSIKNTIVALTLVFFLSFSIADTIENIVSSPETFIACKALDIASTSYVITHGIGYEANPIVAPLIANGNFPLILLSAGVYWLMKKIENPKANSAVNILTCAAAVNNILLIP